MASADGITEDRFLSHAQRVLCEIRAMFQRAHKLLQDREAGMLAELKQVVYEYTGVRISQQIDELSISKDGLGNSFKALGIAKDSYRSVSLEWDVELDKKLCTVGQIRLNAVREGMEHLLNKFKSIRDTQTLVPSRDQDFPPELHQQARELVRTHSHQYSVLKIYDIILINLRAGRRIANINHGFYSISKYPLCLFLDPERPEFHQIRTFSGYYTYEIKEQMESFEPLLEEMGYRYDIQTQLYKLDKDIRLSAGFDDRMAMITCELLLAYEELNFYKDITKYFDSISYFKSY